MARTNEQTRENTNANFPEGRQAECDLCGETAIVQRLSATAQEHSRVQDVCAKCAEQVADSMVAAAEEKPAMPAAVFEPVSVLSFTVRLILPDKTAANGYHEVCQAAEKIARQMGGAWRVEIGTFDKFQP